MSRSNDVRSRLGPRRRDNYNYGSGGFADYSDYYPSRPSRGRYDRSSNSGGRWGPFDSWDGGAAPGSSAYSGRGGMATDIVETVNQLSRMNNPESELALNILNAVLNPNEFESWGNRDYGGQKRRNDWDAHYSLGDGILSTPSVPPRKAPRHDGFHGSSYSQGVSRTISNRPTQRSAQWAARRLSQATNNRFVQGVAQKGPVKSRLSGVKKVVTTQKKKKPVGATAAAKTKEENEKKSEVSKEKKEGDEEIGKENEERKEVDKDGKKIDQKSTTKKKEGEKDENRLPVSYLRCHICQMSRFNSPPNFQDHVHSKRHRRIRSHYTKKIIATRNMLKAQSWLKSQRNIVAMANVIGKITRCNCCECPIKGGRHVHLRIREHRLLHQFTKCFRCKIKFATREKLEEHKLTNEHLQKLSLRDNVYRIQQALVMKKLEITTNIPELKSTVEFHNKIKEMVLTNVDTYVRTKDDIPIYDPARPTGLNHLIKNSQFVCSVCPMKMSQTACQAEEHCKTKEHYDCFLKYLKDKEEEEEKLAKEMAEKEKEKAEKEKLKQEKLKEKSLKIIQDLKGKQQETDNEGNAETNEEEMEEAMKDMENMQVIDKEDDETVQAGRGERKVGIKRMEENGEEMEEVGEDFEGMEELAKELEEEERLKELGGKEEAEEELYTMEGIEGEEQQEEEEQGEEEEEEEEEHGGEWEEEQVQGEEEEEDEEAKSGEEEDENEHEEQGDEDEEEEEEEEEAREEQEDEEENGEDEATGKQDQEEVQQEADTQTRSKIENKAGPKLTQTRSRRTVKEVTRMDI